LVRYRVYFSPRPERHQESFQKRRKNKGHKNGYAKINADFFVPLVFVDHSAFPYICSIFAGNILGNADSKTMNATVFYAITTELIYVCKSLTPDLVSLTSTAHFGEAFELRQKYTHYVAKTVTRFILLVNG